MSIDIQLTLLETIEKDREVVMQELNVDDETLENSTKQITHWLKSQPHLCKVEIEKESIMRYLFGKSFNVARAKMKIENMYIQRALMPEIFGDRNANHPDVIKLIDAVNFCTLPKKIPGNSRVTILSLHKEDPELFDVITLLKVCFMIGDLRLKYETHSSDYYIFDCKGMTLVHAFKLAANAHKMMYLIEKCYGCRIKAYYLINFPDFAHQIATKFKSMMKKKMADRTHLYKDLGDLQKIVPKHCLPIDYGGTEASCRSITMKWLEAMKSPEITNWFSDQEKYKSDETLRPKNDSTEDFGFSGVHGTFRTLNID